MTPGREAVAGRFDNVVITGFMGTGKSAVGRALARRLRLGFVDTDALVRERTGREIPAIFAEEGEAGFRERERQAIASLSGKTGLVVSTGGGAMMDPDNVALLRTLGPIVLLSASPETILGRVGGGEDRPMLDGAATPATRLARIRELLAVRQEAYALADGEVATDGLSIAAGADAILKLLARLSARPAGQAGGLAGD